jgi:hypothetical protein
MPDKKHVVPKELRDRIAKVTNKRARFVLDAIVNKGRVTTEEISRGGYTEPRRAVQDVKDLGFRIKKHTVKHTNGRSSIASYMFDEGKLETGKHGRRLLPKKQRDALIHGAGDKCQICGADHNLQVDHRIPYEVAGESQSGEERPYQILCGSCNRKKSWTCEHCQNWLQDKSLDVCGTCYWAEPSAYSHVAMQQQRRVDLVWIGDEVKDFERIKGEASRSRHTVLEEIKRILKRTE